MKPIAWYDPSNGVVSTDKDCPLFTPLGQVWPLYLPSTWAGLTDEDCDEVERWVEFKEEGSGRVPNLKLIRYIEAKLKEKNS
jgi:hypothetical protein